MRKAAMKAALDVAMPRFEDTSTTCQGVSSLRRNHPAVPPPSVVAPGMCGRWRKPSKALQVMQETPCQRKEARRSCREEEVSDDNCTGKI